MMSFKCKLQLKFRNKNYSSMILNFHRGWNKTIRYHKIKIYEELIYHEKRTTHWCSHFSPAWNTQAVPHQRHFIQSFEITLFSIHSVQIHQWSWFFLISGFHRASLLLLTYLLTPWSRVLLEKLTGSAAS
jgi:hypothetical protein